MLPANWIPAEAESILDVGCNVGAWLEDCARRCPSAQLAGVEINESALAAARERLPGVELHGAGVEQLPFADASFRYVTCLEVIEHVPPESRSRAFQEMRRVLAPGGRLVVSTPHAGWFRWLDSNNVRFHVPGLYRALVGRGRRDPTYVARGDRVEWHEHFSLQGLLELAGTGWKVEAVRYGGLFLYPVVDWLSWPFYRLGASNHPVRRALQRVAAWDYGCSFGRASYGMLVVLERLDAPLANRPGSSLHSPPAATSRT